MNKGDLCNMLCRNLTEYYNNGIENSIRRNNHMNEAEASVYDDKLVVAALVDFVNYVASRQGLDLGLYTKDITIAKTINSEDKQ